MKRLLLCLDGTWNRADGRRAATNIVKIRDALDRAIDIVDRQRVYYDEGVGTANPIDGIVGGAFGAGLSRNVRQAYKYIARHYERGDEIYLIGFSRGAYSARSVAGYIGVAGLLRPENCTEEWETRAWSYYRKSKHDRAPGDWHMLRALCHARVRIRCVAVFDTVGSLGIPNEQLQWIGRELFDFHDTRLGSHIDHAFHALAIDEKRGPFQATLWEHPFNPLKPHPQVEQVWFSGVHSDVGGGYDDCRLSNITLRWMVGKLKKLGVRFQSGDDSESVDDSGPSPDDVHESRSLLYLGSRIRPKIRPIGGRPVQASCRRRSVASREYKPLAERIHVSVVERFVADPEYRPPNLVHVLGRIRSGNLPVVGWDDETISACAMPRLLR